MTEEKIMHDANAIILACKKMIALASEHIAFDKKRPLTFRFGDREIDVIIKEKVYSVAAIFFLVNVLAAQPSMPQSVRVVVDKTIIAATVPVQGLLVLGVHKDDIGRIKNIYAFDDTLAWSIKARVWQTNDAFPDFLFLQEDSVFFYQIDAELPIRFVQLFSNTDTPVQQGTSEFAQVVDLGMVNYKQYTLKGLDVSITKKF